MIEESPNIHTEPMADRERRLFANIEFVLADYDRYKYGQKPDAVAEDHPQVVAEPDLDTVPNL